MDSRLNILKRFQNWLMQKWRSVAVYGCCLRLLFTVAVYGLLLFTGRACSALTSQGIPTTVSSAGASGSSGTFGPNTAPSAPTTQGIPTTASAAGASGVSGPNTAPSAPTTQGIPTTASAAGASGVSGPNTAPSAPTTQGIPTTASAAGASGVSGPNTAPSAPTTQGIPTTASAAGASGVSGPNTAPSAPTTQGIPTTASAAGASGVSGPNTAPSAPTTQGIPTTASAAGASGVSGPNTAPSAPTTQGIPTTASAAGASGVSGPNTAPSAPTTQGIPTTASAAGASGVSGPNTAPSAPTTQGIPTTASAAGASGVSGPNTAPSAPTTQGIPTTASAAGASGVSGPNTAPSAPTTQGIPTTASAAGASGVSGPNTAPSAPTTQGIPTTASAADAMPTLRMLSCIKEEERKMFRLLLALNQTSCGFMKKIFHSGTGPTLSHYSLEDLIMKKNNWTEIKQLEKKVNKTIRENINQDPSMDSFDITTWYAVLRCACHGLALPDDAAWTTKVSDTLENNLKQLKDFRNNLMHSMFSISDAEFDQKLQELRDLLVRLADLWKSRFSINENIVDQMKDSFQTTIDRIRDTPLEDLNWDSFDRTSVFHLMKDTLQKIGMEDLKEFSSKHLSIVNPAALIIGEDMSVNVEEIYTPLEIVSDGRNRSKKQSNKDVCLDELLEVAQSNNNNIIFMEGRAGVGKTTIVKKIVSDSTGKSTMKGLKGYDYVFPITCRDSTYDNIKAIVRALMPTATKAFFDQEDRMMECIHESKILFIFDGYDEKTQATQNIFEELLGTLNSNFTIICTTRPEMIESLYLSILDHKSVLHLRIKGISHQNKEVFVKKYCEKLQSLNPTIDINVNGLLSYLETTGSHLQEHWSLPLNLALVAVIWKLDRDLVLNITCPIELMIQIQTLTQNRLKQRQTNGKSKEECDQVMENMTEFLYLLSEIAVIGINVGDLLIPENKVEKLKNKCNDFNLPRDEMFGAFLLQRHSWSPLIPVIYYVFPHKSLQEFYGARYIYDKIFRGRSDGKTIRDVLSEIYDKIFYRKSKTIRDVLLEINDGKDVKIIRFRGTFTYLLGILHHYKTLPEENLAREIIGLLKEAGVEDKRDWIDLLNGVSCDQVVAKTIIEAVPEILEGDVKIKDKDVFAYSTLIPEKTPESISIEISGRPSDIKTLPKLFNIVANKGIPIEILSLDYLITHEDETQNIMQDLNVLMRRCKIKDLYFGPLPCVQVGRDQPLVVEGLRETKELRIPVWDAKDCDSFFGFLDWKETTRKSPHGIPAPPLRSLDMTIGKDVRGSDIQRRISSRDGGFISVYFPDVSDTTEDHQRVASILKSLFQREIWGLFFPRYQMNPPPASPGIPRGGGGGGGGGAIKRLLSSLGGIRVTRRVVFPSRMTPSDEEERKEIEMEAKRILGVKGFSWGGYGRGIYDMDEWE